MTRWKYYGVAISVAWSLLVISYIRYEELPRAQQYAMQQYFICTEHNIGSNSQGTENCLKKVDADWDSWMNRQWGRIAYTALVPIAIGWVLAFGGLLLLKRYRETDRS